MRDRWVINKLGLINFWYYDEEEFDLSDGKLLLRGANGSGKSVTMQSFIPLLLDGNKRPERLDPFGTTARKIENYLLVNEGETERTAYLYMEFKKRDSDRYITIGMGLKAVKGRPVDSWYFVITDNRRIKVDLDLYIDKGVEKEPLTKKQLENRVSAGGFFTESQTKYKEKVNEYLFGYRDIESYDELINLLINIRTPKLSKDFKPTAMYEILENSLRQLTEDDLRPMSEAMENMDNIKLSIEQLEGAMKAAKQIEGAYNRYNTYMLHEKASNYLKKYKAIKELQYKKDILRQTIKELQEQVGNNTVEKEKLEEELMTSQTKLEQFKDSDVLKIKENLEEVKAEIVEQEREKKTKSKLLDEKKDKLREKEFEIIEIQKKISSLEMGQKKFIDELEGLALDFDFNQHDIFVDDLNFSFVKGALTKHRNLITRAKEFLYQLDNLKKRHEEYLINQDKSVKVLEEIKKDLNESEEYLTTVKEEFIEKVVKWNRANTYLKMGEKSIQNINRCITAIEHMDQVGEYRQYISEDYNNLRGEFITKAQVIQSSIEGLVLEIEKKKLDLRDLENAKEVEYERTEEVKSNRERLKQKNIPFIPLYKALDFKKDTGEESKRAIESALVDMGIIDGLIIPNSYREQVLKSGGFGSDKYLLSEPNIMVHNLNQFLRVDTTELDSITFEDVDDVLSSIFLDNQSENYIDDKGNYGLGLLKGKATENYQLKYIGAASRREHRHRLIDALKEEIAILQQTKAGKENELSDINNRINELSTEYSEIPSTDDIKESLKIISKYISKLDGEKQHLQRIESDLSDMTESIRDLKTRLFEVSDGLEIESNYLAYQEAEKASNEYGDVLNNLEVLCERIVSSKKILEMNEGIKEELEGNIDNLMYDISITNNSIRDKQAKKNAMDEVLAESGYESIKEEIDKCVQVTRNYPKKISDLERDIGIYGERINNTSSDLESQESLIVRSNQLLIQLKKVFLEEYKLGYVEEVQEVTDVTKLCENILKSHLLQSQKVKEEYDTDLNDAYQKNYGILRDYQPKIVTIFNDTQIDDNLVEADVEVDEEITVLNKNKLRKDIHFRVNGKEVNFFKLMETLKGSIEENKLLLSDSEREFFQDILLKTLSNKIKAKIYQSEKWVKDMNSLMQSMNTSSSFKLTLKWVPKKADDEGQLDTKKLVEILQKEDGLIREEDMKELSKHFSSKVKEIVRSYEDKKENRNYFTVIKEILDYRKWYEFKLYSQKEGESSKELTNNAFFQLSGGEKAMGMYIPLFTAVYSRFDIADKKDCPRIVCLDEAFAGVDEGNIRDMFRILREMNLDYILNSQVLWGDYDTVDNLAISEIIRPDNADFVTVINYQWNGREKICLV